jgi:transcription initiation factor TFIIB
MQVICSLLDEAKEKNYVDDIEKIIDKTLSLINDFPTSRYISYREFVGAYFYIACKSCEQPYSYDEVSFLFSIKRKPLGKQIKQINKCMQEKRIKVCTIEQPFQYIPRFCDKLELSEEVKDRAVEIASLVHSKSIFEGYKSVKGISAGCIYISSVELDERRTQEEIANVVRINAMHLRKYFKIIVGKINIEKEI